MVRLTPPARGGERAKPAGPLRYALPVGDPDLTRSWRRVYRDSHKYAFEDFAIRQVALLLAKMADEVKYANRSLVRAAHFFLQPETFA